MTTDQPRMIQGKHAILAVFAIGLIGGVGSWWYYQVLQRRVLQLWGPEAAALMVHAPRAEALWLAPEGAQDGFDEVDLGGTHFAVRRRADVSHSAGLIHLRHSLINDRSFNWSAPMGDCHPRWEYALRFTDGDQNATVLVAGNCRCARLAGRTRNVSLAFQAAGKPDEHDKMPPLERFLKDQFLQSEGDSER